MSHWMPCARNFNRATRDGENMSEYLALLTEAVAAGDQAGRRSNPRIAVHTGNDAQGASSEADFSLVSFVVLL